MAIRWTSELTGRDTRSPLGLEIRVMRHHFLGPLLLGLAMAGPGLIVLTREKTLHLRGQVVLRLDDRVLVLLFRLLVSQLLLCAYLSLLFWPFVHYSWRLWGLDPFYLT